MGPLIELFVCGEEYAWDGIDWNGDADDQPFCPNCAESGDLVTLSGSKPYQQLGAK